MKKLVCLLLSLVLLVSLCACGSTDTTKEPENTPQMDNSSAEIDTGESEVSEGIVGVDKGLFDVNLTIPAEYVEEGSTQEIYDQKAKEAGWKSATLNADGSVTYVMTKAQHEEMLDNLAKSINEGLDELVGSETYPNFVSIQANDDFTEFEVVTKSESLDMAESFSTMAFYIFGGMYNAFNGAQADNISVKFINEATGDVIQEANSNEMGKP